MRRLLLAPILLCACAGSTVERTDPNSTYGGDLSGYWNDIDAQQVASEMTTDCLSHPWLVTHRRHHEGDRPVVKLMGVIKRTDDENVRSSYFTKQIERSLLNSNQVRIVAAFGQDAINVVERVRQRYLASDETAKPMGTELAPDYTLQTFVTSQNERGPDGGAVRAYMINMELVDVESNEKVWIGGTRIRKLINTASSS